ncbi:MAG: prepilin-type N-terminal cleavage/methylation domain-containing protein [Candidatus Sumerlaeota bacterium]|nr:prepilin-type N-terminal cleavage/methylation domain-containing protein [Candidatus Sumerlaeota bacterium]
MARTCHQGNSSCLAAFTLIELLVVVAIISILASIALPNFMEAVTRAKVSRVKSDLRTIATALETYAVDNNCYPPVPAVIGPRYRNLCPLTTPIAYISSVPRDPFNSVDPYGVEGCRTGVYAYGATPRTGPSIWILASDGPDRKLNVDPVDFLFYPGYGRLENLLVIYDPTNGTTSAGDIIRASDRTGG